MLLAARNALMLLLLLCIAFFQVAFVVLEKPRLAHKKRILYPIVGECLPLEQQLLLLGSFFLLFIVPRNLAP